MIPEKVRQKRYGLFIGGVLLLLAGGLALFVGAHNLLINSFGLLAIIVASACFVRASRVRRRGAKSPTTGCEPNFNVRGGPGRLAWAVGLGLLLPLAGSYLWMYDDAIHGGHSGLPAYAFAGIGSACAIAWGYLAAKLVSRGR